MNNHLYFIIFFVILVACKPDYQTNKQTTQIKVNTEGQSVISRIPAPKGFSWQTESNTTYGYFLQNLPLKPIGTPILDYKNQPISNQSEHVAIIDYPIGAHGLVQCADAIICLRAEYLNAVNRRNEVAFHFTSGDLCTWMDFKKGYRPIIKDNNVSFGLTATTDGSDANFNRYLELLYTYCGTISLAKETKQVLNDAEIKTGDMVINPGSPGHVVFIVGTCVDSLGNKLFLLAEGYTPSQSIHIITNPYDQSINPWYRISTKISPLNTARYTFNQTNVRSF